MRNNVATFRHPSVIKTIRRALWLARLECKRKAKAGSKWAKGTQYIANRKGLLYLRVDVYHDGTVCIWGDASRDVTQTIFRAIIGA